MTAAQTSRPAATLSQATETTLWNIRGAAHRAARYIKRTALTARYDVGTGPDGLQSDTRRTATYAHDGALALGKSLGQLSLAMLQGLGRSAHFLARIQVPGRNQPGTGHLLGWWQSGRTVADHTHAFAIGAAALGLMVNAVAQPLDGMAQQPFYTCADQATDALDFYDARFDEMTRLTGVRVYPTQAVYEGISDACHANGNKTDFVVNMVQHGGIPAVDAWAAGYQEHLDDAREAEAARIAEAQATAQRLAQWRADFPELRRRAQLRQAQLLAAHRPHPSRVNGVIAADDGTQPGS